MWRADGVVRARRSRRLPVVLTREEVREVLGHLKGKKRLILLLLYGSGLRLMECLQPPREGSRSGALRGACAVG
jgi:integrase